MFESLNVRLFDAALLGRRNIVNRETSELVNERMIE